MKTFLKICGLTQWEDVFAVAQLGADYLGFILSEASPRYVAPEEAKQLSARIKAEYPLIQTVAVITQTPRADIELTAQQAGCDWVQVHSDISAGEFNRLEIAQKIKVFRVKEALSLEQIKAFQADYYLFDTYLEGVPGGTGRRFNPQHIPESILPYAFIAGGISPETISNCLKNFPRSYAFDINSGVESSPGKKDLARVKAVIKAISDGPLT